MFCKIVMGQTSVKLRKDLFSATDLTRIPQTAGPFFCVSAVSHSKLVMYGAK